MLQAPEPQQLTGQFASEIEDLRTIARLHSLPIGSPERLQTLPLRLAKDVRLRSDLTELVRSLQLRNPDLGLPDVLSLLLIAVGGSASLERRRDMEEVVDLTGAFLASVGGWPGSDVEPLTDIDNPPDHDPRLDLATSPFTEAPEPDLTPQPASQEEPPAPAIESMDLASPAPDGNVTLAEITHALARLERGNLELRLHLDSIDQRICRMEPLLEGVPPSVPVDELPVRSEPPSNPRLPDRAQQAADPVPLSVPRGSVVSEYEVQRQRQEEIKALRRISLTSNFADPVPEALRGATYQSLPQQQRGAILTETRPLPAAASAAADAVSPARVSQPRRDRFAAAREIPGNDADSDPLYTAIDEELARATRVSSREPADKTSRRTQIIREESPTPSVTRPKIPAPDEVYRQVETPDREVTSPSKRLEYLQLDPIAKPVVASSETLIASVPPESGPQSEEPKRRRTGVWIGSVATAAVLGAAGFLYVNGLPSVITGWVGGGSQTESSSIGQSEPATASAQTGTVTRQPPAVSSRPATDAHTPGSAGRVLDARESFSPSTVIEKTSGPTFVPGGVMDGYLISAPRPHYPQLADLAGVQGKISFEAMISKAGDVEALKVLGGPQVLRSAATEAVRQWQYRPFEVKGRPVEVRTIIRVDVASRGGAPAGQ